MQRIWQREFIDIFPLLTFAKEGTDITVPSKEVEMHKWKRKINPEESIDNWLEAFAMLCTVIMKKFPEQGPALCKYNRVIYEEYTCNGGTGWLKYDREFRQKMEQAAEMAWDCREIEEAFEVTARGPFIAYKANQNRQRAHKVVELQAAIESAQEAQSRVSLPSVNLEKVKQNLKLFGIGGDGQL
ncbi:hypothetical protein NDU88_002788 [Pleurodeles waltl]|uniref:Uncharacterized protein n=1 Tax=Pleurodeles waltl TaxID=8319 RepID=A0AAV7LGK2_PLEWA|nr:hypothetical protein NDU88_002788 [Pleurodeles waltl]